MTAGIEPDLLLQPIGVRRRDLAIQIEIQQF
jgi:hypothetical protein